MSLFKCFLKNAWETQINYFVQQTSCVLKKNTFFLLNVSLVVSWAPAAQGPSHDATFYARSLQED